MRIAAIESWTYIFYFLSFSTHIYSLSCINLRWVHNLWSDLGPCTYIAPFWSQTIFNLYLYPSLPKSYIWLSRLFLLDFSFTAELHAPLVRGRTDVPYIQISSPHGLLTAPILYATFVSARLPSSWCLAHRFESSASTALLFQLFPKNLHKYRINSSIHILFCLLSYTLS